MYNLRLRYKKKRFASLSLLIHLVSGGHASNLQLKVRDRLTHPKMPEDIDISGDEIVSVLTAYEGFKEQALNYSERYKA